MQIRLTDGSHRSITLFIGCALLSQVALLAGCGDRNAGEAPMQTETFERFVPVSSIPQEAGANAWSGQFALDTVTGQLCYTYVDPTAKPNSIPVCKDLYSKKP